MKRTLKNVFCILFAAILIFCCAGCGDDSSSGVPTKSEYKAEIVVKGYGSIIVTLKRDFAPITVDHFVKLATAGSYDGSKITRMQAGFVLQAGQGCTDTSTIKGEFSANGVTNMIAHKKGVISMARSSDYNSGSCQFFIVLSDSAQSSLDGNYAGFGEVTDGWDVVEIICEGVTSEDLMDGYYGSTMGFFNESSYITIETIKITWD